jgi:NDP-hexose-3-ketoreductase
MRIIDIVGFGDHIKRNIIPALNRMDDLQIGAIFVRDLNKAESESKDLGMKLNFTSIEKLDKSNQWVYIGTPINTHFPLVKKLLERSVNVICEKVLTESFSKTSQLYVLAELNSCHLIEMSMYKFHRQFYVIKEIISKYRNDIVKVEARFSIPELDEDNIRYDKSACGGSTLDVGYYPVSFALSTLGSPQRFFYKTSQVSSKEVDTAGIVTFDYENLYCICEWAIGTPYKNEVIITLSDKVFKFKRAFSKPHDLALTYEIITPNGVCYQQVSADDHFVNFFEFALSASNIESLKEDSMVVSRVICEIYENHDFN